MDGKTTGTLGRRGALGVALACLGKAAAPRAQTRPFRVGVISDMSSAYADTAGVGAVAAVAAAQMAAEDFGGTVLGRPLEVLQADHQGKPDIGLGIARKWIDEEDVSVLLDLNNSAVAIAVQALAAERKRITIVSSAASDRLTNDACSPYGIHWTYDSYSAGKTLALALALATPGSTWFFLTADNTGGTALQAGVERFLAPAGARVVGAARYPFNTSDMSSYLLRAQASGAKYVTVAGGGSDLLNAMKQATESGLAQRGQTMVAITIYTTDIQAVGLGIAGGLVYPAAFLSTQSTQAAEWSNRFFQRRRKMPNDIQAGIYSGVMHYLGAVRAVGSDDAAVVIAKMRDTPINDMFCTGGHLRKDGRMVHDMFLAQVKLPAESTGPWDLSKLVKTIPGDEAFRPLSEGACPYAS